MRRRHYSFIREPPQGKKSDPFHNKRKFDMSRRGCYGKCTEFLNPFPSRVLKKTFLGQAVQKCLDARHAKTEERGVYKNTLSDKVCSATQQMSVFQQPVI
jgi:hypothetical protein